MDPSEEWNSFSRKYQEELSRLVALLKDTNLGIESAEDVISTTFFEVWKSLSRGTDSIPPLPADLVNAVQRHRKTALSQQHITIITLIWLIAVWLPIIAARLPAKDHALLQDWLATFSFAMALTAVLKARR